MEKFIQESVEALQILQKVRVAKLQPICFVQGYWLAVKYLSAPKNHLLFSIRQVSHYVLNSEQTRNQPASVV